MPPRKRNKHQRNADQREQMRRSKKSKIGKPAR